MSKRAEELANKRWPIHWPTISPKEGEHGEIINFDEWLDDHRIAVQSYSANAGYIQGYEQAEKDYIELAQLWVDSGDVNIMSFKKFLKTKLEE